MSADAATVARCRAECAQRATELGMLLADCADLDTPLPGSLRDRRDKMIDALEAALSLLGVRAEDHPTAGPRALSPARRLATAYITASPLPTHAPSQRPKGKGGNDGAGLGVGRPG